MNTEIQAYNNRQPTTEKQICNLLANTIDSVLTKAESKIWHGHPVWFLDGNPIVGYSKQKPGWRLMFWSGASFGEPQLNVVGKKFKDASIFYNSLEQIKNKDLKRWLKKSTEIQWDYKNIVKRKGRLELVKPGKEKNDMKDTSSHDQRIAEMTFSSVYPMYLAKVEKKGRTKEELHEVIKWLTGFDNKQLQKLIKEKVTFATFFERATLNPNAKLITGAICGYRVEEIKNPLTQKARYMDKLVDELAKGRKMDKILREP
ncbi:MAG: DUF2200 family protein [Pirellulaceae bacterium]